MSERRVVQLVPGNHKSDKSNCHLRKSILHVPVSFALFFCEKKRFDMMKSD